MISRIFGLFLVLASLATIYVFEVSTTFSGMFKIFHWPALVLTGIGPIGILFLCCDFHLIRATWRLWWETSPSTIHQKNRREQLFLHQIAQEFQKEGPRAFSQAKSHNTSYLLGKVLDRLALRIPVGDAIGLFIRERDSQESQLSQSISLLGLAVKMTPSIGMLGTILGMTQLLSHLQDSAQLGPNMSLALLTTFYGLFFSLVLWTPLQNKLERVYELKSQSSDQILHWLELLESQKPAQYLQELIPEPALKSSKGKF